MLIYKQWLELIDLGRPTRLKLKFSLEMPQIVAVAYYIMRNLVLVSQVMIFRLITRGTIEERMMQMTKKKMVLEHLVVGRLKAQNINQVTIFF